MKFGQYELLELIAVGGMAEVYKGRVVGAEGFEKHVAIKRIMPDLAEDERFVKMLLTEARIHSALSHRNIVQIHDLGISEDDEYFIVLEYVEGYDLRVINDQFTAAGEIIPEALSLHVAAEVAQGLHFAHELRGSDGQPLGLVHRDVSPSNVLISLAGEVKLSDFGLAKRRQDRSVVGSLKGNLAYMSPEQARQSPLDRRTDVFSLGAVLFEMLTGRRLREITDEVTAWNEVASGVIPSARSVRPDLPEPFEHLLARALAVEPARRYKDAAAFSAAIRDVLGHMNTPVGASDLQSLLTYLHPPRRPLSLMERSKVIRLGPEAQALGEVISAPATPPPVQLAPVGAPSAPTAPGPHTVASRDRPVVRSSEIDELSPTPAPVLAEPPIRTRRASDSPRPTATLPRPDQPTPRGPLPLTRSRVSGRSFGGRPSGDAMPVWGGGAAVAAVRGWSEPVPPVAVPERHLAAALDTPQALRRPRRETDRIQIRPTGLWRPVVVGIAAALILAAFVVHLAVVPLEVLFTWQSPADIFVTSEPEGALVRLDGVPLSDRAPLRASVHRDRVDHVLEVSYPGYRTSTEIVRYDQSVVLSLVVRLQPEPVPQVAPAPTVSPFASPQRPGAARGGGSVREAAGNMRALRAGR
jgi:serine/threonine protein kinase